MIRLWAPNHIYKISFASSLDTVIHVYHDHNNNPEINVKCTSYRGLVINHCSPQNNPLGAAMISQLFEQ